MNFEEILPSLKDGLYVRRSKAFKDAKMSIMNTKKGPLFKVWSTPALNYTYRLTAEDILANDWELC